MTLRRTTMRPTPSADHRSEPGYREWTKPVYGKCSACGEGDERQRLERHHCVHAQHVRAIDPAREWDLANGLLLGMWCRCHKDHTSAARRLPRSILPAAAIEFAEELLGKDAADLYFARYYRTDAEALA